jgi:hypothetical protein
MKKIIFFIFGFILTLNVNGQDTFPRYYIQNGDTIGVIYSIQQAQKIYNNTVLIDLFKGLRWGCDSLVKKYYVVVSKYEQKQLVDKTLIDQYQKNLRDNDLSIKTLNDKVENLTRDKASCETEKKILQEKITNYVQIEQQLKDENRWMKYGLYGLSGVVLFVLGGAILN